MDYLFSNDKPIQSTYSNTNGITSTNQLLHHVSNIIDKPNQLHSYKQYTSPQSTYEDILLQKQFDNVNSAKQSEAIRPLQYSLDTNVNINEVSIQKENNNNILYSYRLFNQPIINKLPYSLIEFNDQLKSVNQHLSLEKKEENNNMTQSAIKNIIEVMKNQQDERMANSSFLSLMKSLDKGDKVINEEKNTIENNREKINEDIKLNELWNNISKEVELIPSSLLPNQYYSTALKCLGERNPVQALSLLQADSINNPENAEGYYLQAKIHMDNGRDDLAIACAKTALNIDYFHLSSYLILATCYSNEGDELKAIEYIIKWLKLNTPFDQYYNKSNALLNVDILNNENSQGSTRYAIESNGSLTEMIYKELTLVLEKIRNVTHLSNLKDVLLSLGICHMALVNYDRAQETFIQLTQSFPKDYTSWNRLGAIMNNNKQQGKAIEMYKKALDINPNYPRCLTNMGISYLSMNDNVNSAQYFIKALNVNKDNNDVWNYLNSIFFSMERNDLLNASMKRDLNTLNSMISVL